MGGGGGGAGGVGLDGCNQGHALPRSFQLAIDAEMIAAEGSSAGNGYTQNGFAAYLYSPLPSTHLRQRL